MTRYYVQLEGREVAFEILKGGANTLVNDVADDGATTASSAVDFAPVFADAETGAGLYSLIVNGRSYQVHIMSTEQGMRLAIGRYRFDVRVLTEREWRLEKVAPRQTHHGGQLVVSAPIPGLVKAVVVAQGEDVHANQRLVVLEAMKMENDIMAPRQGRVTAIHVSPGATVEGGKPLVTLD